MKGKTTVSQQPPLLTGKRHSVGVQYTNKDAQERLYSFLQGQGPDVNAHELAVDFYAENPEFSEGFQVYSVVHVLEDIIKHMLNRVRPEPTTEFQLPLPIIEDGGLPQYIPYHSETGQLRYVAAGEAEWFHLDGWRDADNRAFKRRSERHSRIRRIVAFFEPYMKGNKVTVRHVCESLRTARP